MKLPLEWISKDSYKHALRILNNATRMVCVKTLTYGEVEVYVLSESQEEGAEITSVGKGARVRQYQRTLRGEGGRTGRALTWDEARKFSFCMHRVVQRTEGEQCCSCNVCPEGNPLDMKCTGCQYFQQVGVCAHILAATHLYYRNMQFKDAAELPANSRQYNVRFQTAALYGSTGKRNCHRSTRDMGGLHRDMDNNNRGDSSDEDQDTNVYRNTW